MCSAEALISLQLQHRGFKQGYSKDIPTRAKSLDKATRFEKILRSKTDGPKIKTIEG
jgi:hypothetical protein